MGFKDILRGAVSSSFRKRFKDNFVGSSETGLGVATDGSSWNAVRGQFNIDGSGKAQATGTDYPIATVDMGVANVDISIVGASAGPSAALWVTDSGNWFAVGLAREAVSCNCYDFYNTETGYCNDCIYQGYWNTSYCNATSGAGYCIYYTGGNCIGNYNAYVCNANNTANCTANNTATCKTWGGGNCKGFNATFCSYSFYSNVNKKTVCGVWGGGTCTGYNATTCNAFNTTNCKSFNTTNCKTFSGGNCNIGFYNVECALWSDGYTCTGGFNSSNPVYGAGTFNYQAGPYTSCSTCYPQYIRVIQSVANSVSTLAQWTVSSVVNSFKVKTSGNQIQVDAFQNSDFTSQIDGTLTYTPTSVNVETRFGIMISPSSYDQQTTIDDVEIKRNPS